MPEKQKLYRSLSDLGGASSFDNTKGGDEKIEKLKKKEEKKEAERKAKLPIPKYGSINVRTDDKIDKDEGPIYKHMDGGMKALTVEDKAKYEHEGTYTKNESLGTEDDNRSSEYEEHIKNKNEQEERSLQEKAEIGLDKVYAQAKDKSDNGLIQDYDWLVKKEEKKRELQNKNSFLSSITKQPDYALTYTTGTPSTREDNGIIVTPPMANMDQVTDNKPRDKGPLGPEDLKLQALIYKQIDYWKKKLAGTKPEDLIDFRARNYKFIREALTNTIAKKIGERDSITGTTAADVNKKSDINKLIKRIEAERDTIHEAINKKIPLPEGLFFDPVEVKLDKELFQKMRSVHEGSIVKIPTEKQNFAYKITKVEDGKVFYFDLNTKKPYSKSLKEIETILRNPNNTILDVRNPAPKENLVKVADKKISEKLQGVLNIEKDLGFVLNTPLLLERYLKLGKEEAQVLFDEYVTFKNNDNTKGSEANNETTKLEEDLKAIIQRRIQLQNKINELKKKLETAPQEQQIEIPKTVEEYENKLRTDDAFFSQEDMRYSGTLSNEDFVKFKMIEKREDMVREMVKGFKKSDIEAKPKAETRKYTKIEVPKTVDEYEKLLLSNESFFGQEDLRYSSITDDFKGFKNQSKEDAIKQLVEAFKITHPDQQARKPQNRDIEDIPFEDVK